jgi:predicted aldo/keto reductase-like oxidoreductase
MGNNDRAEGEMSRREFLRRAGATAASVGMGGAMASVGALAARLKETKMKTRPLGQTGHHSSLLTFGGVMLGWVEQKQADEAVHYALEHGVNHFDVGPSYGDAELRLGPALEGHRDGIFLAGKTLKRTRKEAEEELRETLRRLRTDHLDLYQFHALNTREELDAVTGPGGAWELFQEARQQGLVRHLGITGHQPSTQLEALRRMPLETVMLPVNFVEEQHTHMAQLLLKYAAEHHLGVIAIKAISAGKWTTKEHAYGTWYRPYADPEHLRQALRYTLSQPVTTAAAAGDIKLLKPLIAAAEAFTPLSASAQKALLAAGKKHEALFEEA